MTRFCFICKYELDLDDYLDNGGTREQWDNKNVGVVCCDCVNVLVWVKVYKNYEVQPYSNRYGGLYKRDKEKKIMYIKACRYEFFKLLEII